MNFYYLTRSFLKQNSKDSVRKRLKFTVYKLLPEEAVNEVKRQAMSELQKAVSEAERKAHEMISSERAKMERTVAEAKRQAAEDALSIINQQEDSSEVSVTFRFSLVLVDTALNFISMRFCFRGFQIRWLIGLSYIQGGGGNLHDYFRRI